MHPRLRGAIRSVERLFRSRFARPARAVTAFVLIGWLGETAGAAAAPSPSSVKSDVPVALPPFFVEEATKGPPWRYVEAGGFEVLSRCSDRTTRRVVEAHDRLHQLLEEILPSSLQLRLAVPRALILYDQELQPAASREVVARLLQTPARQPALEVPVVEPGRGLRPSLPRPEPQFSFLPNLRLWDRDSMTVFMIVRRDDFNPDTLSLTQDYVAYLMYNRVPALPLWFVSGFQALYAQVKFENDALEAPALTWISPLHTSTLKSEPAKAPGVQPLDAFFGLVVGEEAPEDGFDPRQRWRAQAELFVRWGLDPESDRRAAFWRFVELAATRRVTEQMVQECFGIELTGLHAELVAYRTQAVKRGVRYKPARLRKLPALALRNATDLELGRIKGDWERLEIAFVRKIAPALTDKYIEQARRTLQRAYERVGGDPSLLAVMGLCEVDAGDDRAAREYLETAAQLGPLRPRAWYELARLRLAAVRGGSDVRSLELTASQAAEILRPLFEARAGIPPQPEVYELIAEVWEACAVKPTRGHLAVLDEGIRLFPRRATLLVQTAALNLRHGYREQAREYIAAGLRSSLDAPMRERFEALARELGP